MLVFKVPIEESGHTKNLPIYKPWPPYGSKTWDAGSMMYSQNTKIDASVFELP